jgi:histone-lysine N-methyltransferase SETMAR
MSPTFKERWNWYWWQAPQRPTSHGSDFWDSEGTLLVDFLERGATINSQRHVQALKKFKQRSRRVRPNRKTNQVLLLHDNSRPRISLRTKKEISNMRWTVLCHSPYSPDLVPSDFHVFGPQKYVLLGRPLAEDDELKHNVREKLRCLSK